MTVYFLSLVVNCAIIRGEATRSPQTARKRAGEWLGEIAGSRRHRITKCEGQELQNGRLYWYCLEVWNPKRRRWEDTDDFADVYEVTQ